MDLGSYVRDECIGTSECSSKFCPLRSMIKSEETCGVVGKKPPHNIGDGRTTTFRGESYTSHPFGDGAFIGLLILMEERTSESWIENES